MNKFTYLGVVVSFKASSFRYHVLERSRKGLLAMGAIENPRKLSLKTVMQLLNSHVAPAPSYRIQLIWKYLTVNDLIALE